MNDREVKEFAKAVLQHLGLQAEDIPPQADRKSPDLLARFGTETFLIEVKAKGDDRAQLEQEREVLDRGEVYSRSVPTGSRNTLSGIICDGVEQLVSYAEAGDAIRLLWLQCEGNEADDHRRRFRATLFGLRDIVDMDAKIHALKDCYYFGLGEFFRHWDSLDGALLFVKDEGQLCINTLSPRVEEFRRSKLVQAFAAGLCDPDALEVRGEAYIVDGDIDRKNKDLVMQYLVTKYRRPHLIDMEMKHHSAKMRVPDQQ